MFQKDILAEKKGFFYIKGMKGILPPDFHFSPERFSLLSYSLLAIEKLFFLTNYGLFKEKKGCY